MSALYYLDKDLIEKLCHRLAVTFFSKINEPIPPFCTCNESTLDACLNLPKATFDGKELYPDLISKSAILYYSIIKNHPFINGNKRVATTSLIVFLYINNLWLNVGQNFLYNLALEVAGSEKDDMDKVKKMVEEKIRQNIIPLKIYKQSTGSIGFLLHLENLKINLKRLFSRK